MTTEAPIKPDRVPPPSRKRGGARSVAGRPTIFDDTKAELILKWIRIGTYVETAVAAAGISKQTFYTWMRDGARGKSERLAEFAEQVNQAVAQAEVSEVAIIHQAAATNWTAA